jgi:nucleotide-binding universal stress UspA family protein
MTAGAPHAQLEIADDTDDAYRPEPTPEAAEGEPILAAVDSSSASTVAVRTAVDFAAEFDVPIVFVYVRRGPADFFGTPEYERRLAKEMARGRRVLDQALAVAEAAGVSAEGEILEGSPRRRIAEFASDRGAQLVVVGSRGRKVGRSVSRGVAQAAKSPVVVARGPDGLAIAGKAA